MERLLVVFQMFPSWTLVQQIAAETVSAESVVLCIIVSTTHQATLNFPFKDLGTCLCTRGSHLAKLFRTLVL